MKKNKLKEILQADKAAFGIFCKLNDPAISEIAGLTGFDFVIIDMEHGPYSFESAQNMIRAAGCRGITPIVRATSKSEGDILRALDIGAHGIQVPQISSREDAEIVITSALYHPEGQRGICRFVRAADYSVRNQKDYFMESNRELLTIIHIEGVEGINNLGEILEVNGVDIIFIGPYDLSQSCGVPGQTDHPLVEEKMRNAVELARKSGKRTGTFVESPEAVSKWEKLGVRYFAYSVDTAIIAKAFRNILSEISNRREL